MITARAGLASLTDIEFGRQITAHFHTVLLFIYLRLAPGSFHVWLPSSSSLLTSFGVFFAVLIPVLSLFLPCLVSYLAVTSFARSSSSVLFFFFWFRHWSFFGVKLPTPGRGQRTRQSRSISQTEVESNGICQISA